MNQVEQDQPSGTLFQLGACGRHQSNGTMWLQAEEKRRQAELAEEEQRREEAAREAAARRQRRLARRKADAGRRVPPEPTTPTTPADVCRILVRLPAGRKLERRFHRHQHTLQVLFFQFN